MERYLRTFLCLAIVLLVPTVARGLYAHVETERVPIERVIENLKREFEGSPGSAELAWRIGRLYGMAYAQKEDSVRVSIDQDPNFRSREFFGYQEPAVVHSNVVDSDYLGEAMARRSLTNALAWYQTAYELDPTQSRIALGYGWCLEEAGKDSEAKSMYRKVIDMEMAREHRFPTVAAEALHYLIDLLNPLLEWPERQLRKRQLDEVAKWPTFITPIAIPLGERRELVDVVRDDLAVCFDADGSGRDIPWTWIAPDAGWLVHDFLDQGNVTSGRQLFGDVTFWIFWNSGYEALASLDDNGDRWLRGEELRGLKIWNDRNSNGFCERDELRSLEYWGVVGLSCDHSEVFHNGRRMWASSNGVALRDGTFRTSFDVVLIARGAERI